MATIVSMGKKDLLHTLRHFLIHKIFSEKILVALLIQNNFLVVKYEKHNHVVYIID